MKALIFIENKGQIDYKCDTFWSRSNKISDAKIYNDDSQDQIDRWITPFDYSIEKLLEKNLDNSDKIIDIYNNCKMGYRIIKNEFLDSSGFSAKSGTEEKDLGPLIYTHQVIINSPKDISIVDIRKVKIREEKINQILN
jgi:hypothetical protein